jgi:hypothetical protein
MLKLVVTEKIMCVRVRAIVLYVTWVRNCYVYELQRT